MGVAAGCGMARARRQDAGDAALDGAATALLATRPTAVNLRWAVEDLRRRLKPLPPGQRAASCYARAAAMADEDVAINRAMGDHGLGLIRAAQAKKGGGPVNILTHCNAGWLATVGWGTALRPVYSALAPGVPVQRW